MTILAFAAGLGLGVYFHNGVALAAEFVSGQLLRALDAVKGYFFTK